MENKPRGSPETRKLRYELLEKITNCFAEDQKLGSGAFGSVFKGVHENGETIAVKVLRNALDIDDKKFMNEFQNLAMVKHENVVRLVGYCNEKEEKLVDYNEKKVIAQEIHLALCMEYVDNGSLSHHISDGHPELNWHIRYKLIKGVCEGLKYLREGLTDPIWHLDLKPENILLDKNMVPKIADFGLSRLLGEEKTQIATSHVGTFGYLPPEYIEQQVISKEFDIFSLGVIITKIMVGSEGYKTIADMTEEKFINHVHNYWREKVEILLSPRSLDVFCQQVKTCIAIALKCLNRERRQRPTIQEIVSELTKTESMTDYLRLQLDLCCHGDYILPENAVPRQNPSELGGNDSSIGHMKKSSMPFEYLRKITNNFSMYRKVGEGCHGTVYKGILPDGQEVAVKRYNQQTKINAQKMFQSEVDSLIIGSAHNNIVRLLGYFHEIRNEVVERNNNYFIVESEEYLLCYEYVPNGSLDQYIYADHKYGELDWKTRFNIILGICQALQSLHHLRDPIIHMNLTPRNVLLDDNMVPKLSDFTLSRFLGPDRTTDNTLTVMGPKGYMAPEFLYKGQISKETDIFSLGVIILEIVTGQKVDNQEPHGLLLQTRTIQELWPKRNPDLSARRYIEKVRETYMNVCIASKCTSVDTNCIAQVEICIKIGLMCIEGYWRARPPIDKIINMLNERSAGLMLNKMIPRSSRVFSVHPLELFFKSKQNRLTSCSLHLSNSTDDHVPFKLLTNNLRRYFTKLPLCGIVPPKCTYTLTLTMREHKKQPPFNSDEILTLQSSVAGAEELKNVDPDSMLVMYDKFFHSKESNEIQNVMLKVSLEPPIGSSPDDQSAIEIVADTKYRQVMSVDVHPVEKWVLTSNQRGNVCIWNYQTQFDMHAHLSKDNGEVLCFHRGIREKWIVAGDGDGYLYVYSYDTIQEIKGFQAHDRHITSLDTHPTLSFVLSASDDHVIKLWDWNNDWECIQTFEGHSSRVTQIMFHPNDSNSFASASVDHTVKLWNRYSPEPKFTDGHPDSLLCLQYFIGGNRQYLIYGSSGGAAKIWDLETKTYIHTLHGHEYRLNALCWHPEVQVLITGSADGTVRVWNSTTYRLENIISFNLGGVNAFGYIKGLRRIVVGCDQGIAMMEVDLLL